MSAVFDVGALLDYTDWDRAVWEKWFRGQDNAVLAIGLGPNNDGRIKNVGELVRHIFSAEKRYVERSLGVALSDTSTIPADNVGALFDFGRASRRAMRDLLATYPAARWDETHEMKMGTNSRMVTPRKMVAQAITHEIRHWAQIATILRIEGHKSGFHDLLASPVFDPARS